MTLRKADAGEVPAIIEMARPTFEAFVPFGGSEKMVSHMLTGLAQFGGYVFVKEHDGQIAGVLAGYVSALAPWTSMKCATEMLFYVRPEFRAGRSAVSLIRNFEKWGRAKGCGLVAVTANHMAGDERVGRLYQRLGYAPLETIHVKRID